jgi:hypothetical protein
MALHHLYKVRPHSWSDPLSILQFNRSASRKSSFFSVWKLLKIHLRNAKRKIGYVFLSGGSYAYLCGLHEGIADLYYGLPL